MDLQTDTKTTFEPRRVIQPIYTGGSVALSEDGSILATCLGEEALLTDLGSGRQLCRIEGDGESITTLALAPDASWVALCSRSLSLRIFALTTSDGVIDAKLSRTLKPHGTPVVTSQIDTTSSLLATGSADGEVKVWDLRGGYTTHTFHGHSGVISALHFFKVNDKGPSVNGKKRKNHQRGDTGAEGSNEATVGFRLASGGEDTTIRIWDLHKRKSVATLDSHASVVRSLDYSSHGAQLLSGSRDKTVLIWDATTWQVLRTVPVIEAVESSGFLQQGSLFWTGGENGRLRVWSSSTGSEITEDQDPGNETDGIVTAMHPSDATFVLSVHADQTLLLHDLQDFDGLETQRIPPLSIIRRISGSHDEIIDLAYIGSQRDMLALATNSEDIRIISLESEPSSSQASPYFGADVALLKGHDDIIITLDVDWSGHWLATGAKDNVARLWRLDLAQNSYTCHATFTGHAESISAVALPSSTPAIDSKEYRNPLDHPPSYLITGSQDKTVKRWDISSKTAGSVRSIYTRKAHDKDINAIETSYSTSAPLFASASQDRTVKIWDVEAGEAIGVLRGHKRGVWSVAFSPLGTAPLTTGEGGGASSSKGMVLTGSGDKSIKIWSLSDYSCLRTFEGHVNSILKVVWLPPAREGRNKAKNGVKVASAAGDGLVKVWHAQTSECAATLDNHIDRVWALAVKPETRTGAEQQGKQQSGLVDVNGEEEGDLTEGSESTLELVSGSADSTLTFWADTTETTALRATTQASARIEQDQELQNHIRSKNYREAIVLALQLNHPKRLLDLFMAVMSAHQDKGSFTGRHEVDEVLATLSDGQLWNLLRRVRDWNTNGKTHNVAQHVLHAILRLNSKDRLLNLRRRRRLAQANDESGDDGLADAVATLSTRDDPRDKESVKEVLDGLRAYTERHCTRLERTSEERFVLMWALQQMDEVSGEDVTNGFTNGDHAGDAVMLDNGL